MSSTNWPNANHTFWSYESTDTSLSGSEMNTCADVPRSALDFDNRSRGRRPFFPAPGQGINGAELPAKRAKEDRRNRNQNQVQVQDQDQDQNDEMMDHDSDDDGYEADCETDCKGNDEDGYETDL